MKKKLTHNLGLKILSLALAFFVWLVVLSIEDPVYTREFSDITVTEVNADAITEAGKAYTFVDGNTVSIKVKGKTSILNRLTKDDFLAVADLSNLSITGAVMVDVSCPKYPGLEISAVGSSTVLKVEIEDLLEKSLNVTVVPNGSVADGYYVGTGTATPNMVTISGPESEVRDISQAVVYVTVTSANTTDITTNSTLELLDSNGNTISSSTLTISQTDIEVTLPIYVTKTVPIYFGVTGEAADGYQVVSTTYEPKEVTLAGRSDDLNEIDSVTLIDYDISGADSSIEDTIIIADYLAESLSDGVTLTDKEASLALVVEIEEVVEETFELPLSRISLTGSSQDYTYTKSNTETSDNTVTLTIQGIASEVSALTTSGLTALVDVTGYTEGEYDLPLSVVFDDNLELVEEVYVHVTITSTADN